MSNVVDLDEQRRLLERLEARSFKVDIEYRKGDLSYLVGAAESCLIAQSAGIYQRGGQLVRVERLEEEVVIQNVRRAPGNFVIKTITPPYLILAMNRSANWVKYDGRSKCNVPIDPPGTVASALLSASGEWKFPVLAGLTAAPTLRADGSLLDLPGYDAASGLYATFGKGDFPAINPRPAKDDAYEALKKLDDLFSEFPFLLTDVEKDEGRHSAHSSVAIAALITAAVRAAVPIAPAIGIDAAKQSSGKTTLAKAIVHVVTGRDPPVLTLSQDESEFKKCLLAILMAGDSCVLIDNVDRPVDSGSLCAVLTSASYSERLLGANQRITVPSTVTWLLTGNHLEFVGDLTSRVMVSTLDPECERPEAREFSRDLLEYVKANRGELLAAALTIPLAYLEAGRPTLPDARSRFATWDDFVRRPLIWLDRPDPMLTQEDVRENDSVRESLIGVHRAWQEIFGPALGSVAEAVKAADGVGQSARPELLEAFLAVAGNKDRSINNKRLGKYLARSVRTVENGLKLVKGSPDPASKNQRYAVVEIQSKYRLE